MNEEKAARSQMNDRQCDTMQSTVVDIKREATVMLGYVFEMARKWRQSLALCVSTVYTLCIQLSLSIHRIAKKCDSACDAASKLPVAHSNKSRLGLVGTGASNLHPTFDMRVRQNPRMLAKKSLPQHWHIPATHADAVSHLLGMSFSDAMAASIAERHGYHAEETAFSHGVVFKSGTEISADATWRETTK